MEFSTRISPTEEAEQDSPDTDFRSSISTPLGGDELLEDDEVMKARDKRDMERSKGESRDRRNRSRLMLIKFVGKVSYSYIKHMLYYIVVSYKEISLRKQEDITQKSKEEII